MIELKLFVFLWMFLAVNSWRSQFVKQKCEYEGRKLENGYFTIPFGDIRIYHCQEHYVSNVTNLEDLKFECKWKRKLGKYEWTAIYSKFSHGEQIFLKDVACKVKKKCIDPVIPENMTRSSKSRYQVFNVVTKGKDQSPGYFTGDILEYNCKTGFTLSKESDANGYQFGSYDLSNHDYEQTVSSSTTEVPVKNTVLSVITCDNDGLWNGVPNADLYFGKCKMITCPWVEPPDHGRHVEFKNEVGMITTFECDIGYKLRGATKIICRTDGDWYPSKGPVCDPILCPNLPVIRNGRIFQDISDGLANSYESVAEYTCNRDYYLNGNTQLSRLTRTCQADGTWSGLEPVCDEASTSKAAKKMRSESNRVEELVVEQTAVMKELVAVVKNLTSAVTTLNSNLEKYNKM